MTVSWSSHAKGQRAAILRTIARELSREDASRWNMKIREAVQHLADFPEAGDSIPETCFSRRTSSGFVRRCAIPIASSTRRSAIRSASWPSCTAVCLSGRPTRAGPDRRPSALHLHLPPTPSKYARMGVSILACSFPPVAEGLAPPPPEL